jgi:hypothetical protein
MGDMGEVFNAMKEESKERRASHREQSPKLLDRAGIPFESKNGGAHLIVEGSECYIDFWPGTGKWISRNGKRGFGVRNLIRYVEHGI